MLEPVPLLGVSADGLEMPRHMYKAALIMMKSIFNSGNSRNEGH